MTTNDERDNTLDHLFCRGYVYHMSDGTPFHCDDVEPVKMTTDSIGRKSTLIVAATKTATSVPALLVSRKRRLSGEQGGYLTVTASAAAAIAFADDKDEGFGYNSKDAESEESLRDQDILFHVCLSISSKEVNGKSSDFLVAIKCVGAWSGLSDAQKAAIDRIQERLDSDRNEGRLFSCAVLEGPGGCGKTRLMSYIMNHRHPNTLVLYLSKQNKRVQDFVHRDCLGGESNPTVHKPFDLTPARAREIECYLYDGNTVGGFALTSEKLIYALAGLRPDAFDTDASALKITNDRLNSRRDKTVRQHRNVIILLDEYTMHQPPLVHAIAHHTVNVTRSTVLMIMGGDRLQCGPVGWAEAGKTNAGVPDRYTDDVRKELASKMNCVPLDVTLDRLQRCRGDRALAACVLRLRRVCDESSSGFSSGKKLTNLVLAKYSENSGVHLYRYEESADGVPHIGRIVPSDRTVLDFEVTTSGLQEEEDDDKSNDSPAVDQEEWDERGVAFVPVVDPPMRPEYDVQPLVEHFSALYKKLAKATFTSTCSPDLGSTKTELVYRSTSEIRHYFPIFIVLTNNSCNLLAETLLLALYTQVRRRLLAAPNCVQATETNSHWTWKEHMRRTLRQCVRRLEIDQQNPIQRQTLFVGMLYRMTSTVQAENYAADGICLCNGELVVLTSIVYRDGGSLENIDAVVVRKLERDSGVDLVLRVGLNRNRMTNAKNKAVMPFVPYVSENIYQMQGYTMSEGTSAFVDLSGASSTNAYVALSRFQNSRSIKGIIVSE